MAGLNVTEFEELLGSGNAAINVPVLKEGTTAYDVVIGSPSPAFQDKTRFLMLVTDTACRININAAATASSTLLPANVPIFIGVKRGQVINTIAA